MSGREFTRRAALEAIGLGVFGTVAASTGVAEANGVQPDGNRPDERIQFVEADPEAGFNFPYWLATPETFRSEPVPLFVEWNDMANPGQPLTGGGPDKPITVAEHARGQVKSLKGVSGWVSEQLGVPQLVPVFPEPSRTQKTTQIDRETLLIEEGDLERIDRQLLRMTEHARQEILHEHEMHDQLLFWGNSSAGNAAQHMAVLHPEEIMAYAASGINGAVTLPLAGLGGQTLKYQIGIADLEALTGSPFDAEAFDEVNKFNILGAHDVSDRLKFKVPGKLPGVWSPEQYEIAKAVYGREMAEDRLPRCQIAYEKAGISGQFRLYPEMTHDPGPAGPDVLEFLRRSIKGESVSKFGQRLTLPFDRTVTLKTSEPMVGDQLDFAVSGDYPPPEGLVTYNWQVDDGRTSSGSEATFTFEDAKDYEVTLSMETAHGQVAHRGMSLMAQGSSFAAYRYDVTPPRTELMVSQSILIETDITNVGTAPGDRRPELYVDGKQVDSRGAALEPGASKRIPFSHPFDEPGEFEVKVPPAYKQTITVNPKQSKIVISGANLWPKEVEVGKPIRVTAMVENVGTGSGELPITLKANGNRIAKTSVSLGVDESQLVTFEHVFEDAGDYELMANNESVGTVTVAAGSTRTLTASPQPTASPTTTEENPNPSPTTTESSGQPGFGMLTALAGIGSAVSYLLTNEQNGDR